MKRDEYVSAVLERADRLAAAYGAARKIVHDSSGQLTDAIGARDLRSVKAIAASAISAFETAEEPYKWLAAQLDQIQQLCGDLPREDALVVLKVFHAMHASADGLLRYAETAERMDANSGSGHATSQDKAFRTVLDSNMNVLIKRLAGQPEDGFPLSGIAGWAVNNLRASLPMIQAVDADGGHSPS